MKPMLAFKYEERRAVFPCHAQPKLNGVRGIWCGDFMESRGRPKEDGKVWRTDVIQHIVDDMTRLQFRLGMPLPCDGELYTHGMSLQEINSRIAVKRTTPHPEAGRIRYAIFDLWTEKPFWMRALMLDNVRLVVEDLKCKHVNVVECKEILDHDEFEMYHKLNRQRGYEGTMYRESKANYGFRHQCGNQENRWHRLMKRKQWLDLNCRIVGVVEGRMGKTGQFLGKAGALELETPEGVKFNAGSGLIVRHRSLLWEIRESIIGTTCRIKFPEYSDTRCPLQPTIEMIDDERFER